MNAAWQVKYAPDELVDERSFRWCSGLGRNGAAPLGGDVDPQTAGGARIYARLALASTDARLLVGTSNISINSGTI